jgi:cyclohexanecarboxylate-CoA ligase
VETFDAEACVPLFNRHGVTISGGSTAFYLAFLREQRKDPSTPVIPSLRILSGGGAPKPPEVFRQVRDEMGIPIMHGYGMTECPMICQGTPSDTDDQLAHTEGAPIQGCQVDIVRMDGTAAAPGEEGEVRVSGPMLFKGYTDPALDAEAFDDRGRFRTGDLGVRRADGHVTLTGRVKDIIIRNAENISATEVEDCLFLHPAVADVAVIGVPHPRTGERAVAVVQLAPGVASLTLDDLGAHCLEHGLAKWKIPEQLELLDAIPRNSMGKIEKPALRKRYSA